jgi:cellulose synthase (UDP-forming)
MAQLFFGVSALAAFVALFGLALVPVEMSLATDMAIVCVLAVLLLSLLPGRLARLFFVTVCCWVVVRYIAWRFASLPTSEDLFATAGTWLLLGAELYGGAMLLLGLFVNALPLEREPAPLPENPADWPSIDVYIPTYSEPAEVVAATLIAARNIDYPADKFRVYVLDDGHPRANNPRTDPAVARRLAARSHTLQTLCKQHGATWLTRQTNEHAKSGNLNAAMQQTSGELILVLDADHVPTRDILKNTAGFFVDGKLAFVQTPHFFLNQDPVEKNLGLGENAAAESEMFYRFVQKGLDLWNTSFFCGSAALIRRTAVLDVGGFSVDSITEDASTSVKMHQRGWKSAYLGIPMVAGLQPETFGAFTTQRLRWAVGMMQIFVRQNPLLVRGLTLPQRIAYLLVVAFWFFPFARTVFFVAPLLPIFFNVTIYPIGVEYFLAFTVPYLVALFMSFQRTYGSVRRLFISELYESLQCFYALPAILATLLRPSKPTFKVTPKGERLDREFISEFRAPFYAFYAVTVVALLWGTARIVLEPGTRAPLTLSVAWLTVNFVLLSGCLGVLLERVQRRARARVRANEVVTLVGEFGTREAMLVNMNERGALVRTFEGERLGSFSLLLPGNVIVPTRTVEGRAATLGAGEHAVLFDYPERQQERAVSELTYGSSRRWLNMWEEREMRGNFVLAAFVFVVKLLRHGARHIGRLLERVD